MKFFMKHQKKILAVLALVLALLMLLPTISMIFTSTSANATVSQKDIDKLKDQAAQLEQSNQKLNLYLSQLGTVQGVKHIANEKLGLVDPNDFFFKPVDHTNPE